MGLTNAHDNSDGMRRFDDDLVQLIEVWESLPESVRAGILAMAKATVVDGDADLPVRS